MTLTIYFCLFIFIITFKIGLGFIVYKWKMVLWEKV